MDGDLARRHRRHAACARAAGVHRRAATVELQAAAFFERLGDTRSVARHRAAAVRQAELARADEERAARS